MANVVAEAISTAVSSASGAAGAAAGTTESAASSVTGAVTVAVPMPMLLKVLSARVSGLLCSGWLPVKLPHVDECQPLFGAAVLCIFLAPFLWNLLGRLEYYTKILSTVFVRPGVGAIALAAWVFFFSLYRDAVLFAAIQRQPKLEYFDTPLWHVIAGACAVVGATLVLSSFWRLGFYGTYLGDYFGILMDSKVTGFPFNIFDHPMYDGSTLLFLAKAIMEKSPAGIALTVWVFVMYRLACIFEGSFTTMIYMARERRQKSTMNLKSQ